MPSSHPSLGLSVFFLSFTGGRFSHPSLGLCVFFLSFLLVEGICLAIHICCRRGYHYPCFCICLTMFVTCELPAGSSFSFSCTRVGIAVALDLLHGGLPPCESHAGYVPSQDIQTLGMGFGGLTF